MANGLKAMENNTLDYYDKNADDFIKGTVSVDFSKMQDKFISLLSGEKVLDFGCGSGRDTRYFLDAGLVVTAVDGSETICEKASEYTGIEVKQMLFQELNEESEYDGIRASASVLHLSKEELKPVLKKWFELCVKMELYTPLLNTVIMKV